MSVTFSHLNEADNSAPFIFFFFKFLLVPQDKKQKRIFRENLQSGIWA